jgi:hypothetical protein
MAETVDQIERQIDRTRRELGHNLEDIERRVEAVTDWRTVVRRYPAAAMAAACVGGIAVAAMLPHRSSAPRRRAVPDDDRGAGGRSPSHAWQMLRDYVADAETAAVTVAGQRLAALLGRWIPEFQDELGRAKASRAGSAF